MNGQIQFNGILPCNHMQVEPVRWPHATARKVINRAVEEAVSEALLQDAQRAIDCGFQGSISRCNTFQRCDQNTFALPEVQGTGSPQMQVKHFDIAAHHLHVLA